MATSVAEAAAAQRERLTAVVLASVRALIDNDEQEP